MSKVDGRYTQVSRNVVLELIHTAASTGSLGFTSENTPLESPLFGYENEVSAILAIYLKFEQDDVNQASLSG